MGFAVFRALRVRSLVNFLSRRHTMLAYAKGPIAAELRGSAQSALLLMAPLQNIPCLDVSSRGCHAQW